MLTNTDNNNLTAFENATSKLITPIQNGLTHLKNKINVSSKTSLTGFLMTTNKLGKNK